MEGFFYKFFLLVAFYSSNALYTISLPRKCVICVSLPLIFFSLDWTDAPQYKRNGANGNRTTHFHQIGICYGRFPLSESYFRCRRPRRHRYISNVGTKKVDENLIEFILNLCQTDEYAQFFLPPNRKIKNSQNEIENTRMMHHISVNELQQILGVLYKVTEWKMGSLVSQLDFCNQLVERFIFFNSSNCKYVFSFSSMHLHLRTNYHDCSDGRLFTFVCCFNSFRAETSNSHTIACYAVHFEIGLCAR